MHKLLARDAEAIAYAVERSCVNKAEVVAADERETNDVRATLNLGHTFGHAIETGTGYGTLLHGEAVSIGMVMAADLSYRMVSGWLLGANSWLILCVVRCIYFLSYRHLVWQPCCQRSGFTDCTCFVLHGMASRWVMNPYTVMVSGTQMHAACGAWCFTQGWIDRSILDRTRAVLQAARLPTTVPPPMTSSLFKSLMAVDKKVAEGKLRLILLKGPLGQCVVTGDFDPAKLDETLAAFCPATPQ